MTTPAPYPIPGRCIEEHDHRTAVLSTLVCIGLVISYLPQQWRIFSSKSSQGLSHYFLFLGSTSSISSFANVLVLQWEVVKCCSKTSKMGCFENVLGVIQVGLQMFMFNVVFVLFMIYYPPTLKYDIHIASLSSTHPTPTPATTITKTYRTSLSLFYFTFTYTVVVLSLTIGIPLFSSPGSSHPSNFAAVMGIISAILAMTQYLPQLLHTFMAKVVGSLSIPMMCIQTPGTVVFILALVGREGVNWTTWLTYSVTGVCQGCLLIMCILWKIRQRAKGIDDYGKPVNGHVREWVEEQQRLLDDAVVESEDGERESYGATQNSAAAH
ncbi:hypothetical protein BT69DRAFT_1213221 [Atractiella rhizophila]|nr:hypothetical protein BT69DRAFT_1213221 [Atractiella rhizophila]